MLVIFATTLIGPVEADAKSHETPWHVNSVPLYRVEGYKYRVHSYVVVKACIASSTMEALYCALW